MKNLPHSDSHDKEETSLEVSFEMPIQAEVTLENADQTLDPEDLAVANGMLRVAGMLWKDVKNMYDLRIMMSNTIDATKHRRAVLSKPYGCVLQTQQKNIYDPLD